MDPPAVEGEDWELRHDDDGFTYKILKRRRLATDPPPAGPQSPPRDPRIEEQRRRERKRRTLVKLKGRYKKEIDRWELLSSTLLSLQGRANERLEVGKRRTELDQTGLLTELGSGVEKGTEDTGGSLVDELLVQAESQEAIINDVSNLCNIAEAMCDAQQEQLVQTFIDLPIWGSPRELMASLCDE
uniref:Uncharacterized protein n=1 Tax=Rhizophora mucronata TaxID=61149 RepID=A0A2P2MYU9_RHIMU